MNEAPEITWPFVSVIVPVYNDCEHIELLLKSLLGQDYPEDLYEIIVVDNNSTDTSREIVQKFPVMLLEEAEIQSSYAARNRGIRHARGRILVFIDSDCTADSQWLRRGVGKIMTGPADLVGGKVEFSFSRKKTAAECFDSLTNFNFETKISRGVAGTGNLFVKAEVFKSIGLFLDNIKSGGDVQWTGKATQNGFSLVYAPDAIVYHPARFLEELLRKLYRVSVGMGDILINEQAPKSQILRKVFGKLKPYRISFVKQLIAEKGSEDMNKKLFSIWAVAHLCRFVMALGLAKALFHKIPKTSKAN
jgi:glycosyltransferase involved in cell wall biosynthesis